MMPSYNVKMKRDYRGWRIPRTGTRSWEIYQLLHNDFKAGEIIKLFQEDKCHTSIRVLISQIMHPAKHNKWSNDWQKNNPKRAKEIAKNSKHVPYSKYVKKLVKVLGISHTEAVELERKELEKVNGKLEETSSTNS